VDRAMTEGRLRAESEQLAGRYQERLFVAIPTRESALPRYEIRHVKRRRHFESL
jgi:hypothetical protein